MSASKKTDWVVLKNVDLIRDGILEIGDGYRAKNIEMGNTGLPFVRAGNINNGFNLNEADILDETSVAKAGSKISRPGDVVLTSKGTFGRFAFVQIETPRFVYSPQLCYWRVKDSSIIDPRFLFFWMHSSDFWHQAYAVKNLTDMADYVSLKDQRNMTITVPPITTQRRIADILSNYDRLIENNIRRIKILEEMAQMLYQEWFVNFRFPGHEGVPMVESELGLIPQGWKVEDIGDVVETLGGGTPSTKSLEYWEEGTINWFSPSDLTASNSMFIEKSSKQITALGLRKSSARLFPAYSVMMTSRATIGVIAINTTEACTNQGFITCIPNQQLSVHQIYYWMIKNREKINNLASGATFKEINKGTFRQLPIVVPDLGIQKTFSETINPVFRQIENFQRKNANLRQTRDLLLPKLISGEIDVETLESTDAEALNEVEEMAA
jgi:type I restriction enzyme, S subunit